ncbi:MAG: ribbon-helix-helix protein, CopG family [Nitrospiraceae bacterium]|nr:MAG: ribbon-helix-helix protein, CopG family [Nitrospiraceae bacterium]
MAHGEQDSTTISIRVPAAMREQLEHLAEATGRSKSFLTSQALEDYLKREAWQVAAIKKGVAAAERGEFAGDDEVAKRFAKRGVKVAR